MSEKFSSGTINPQSKKTPKTTKSSLLRAKMLLSFTKDTIYRPTRQTFVTEMSNYWITVESECVILLLQWPDGILLFAQVRLMKHGLKWWSYSWYRFAGTQLNDLALVQKTMALINTELKNNKIPLQSNN